MADDPVLESERAHLERARACLTIMKAAADGIADYGVDQLAGFALGKLRAERLAALSADPDAPPFFGRIDRDREDADPLPGAEVLHIGRRHVRDERGDPVVIDWRAPLARPFYRATPADRQGVRLRRRFGFRAAGSADEARHENADGGRSSYRVLSSFEDEHLDLGEQLGLGSGLLREEIERPRVGPMRDIVATIQPDQDELVRAGLDVTLCIQGAPGTGKTAVGLHRAAYLLYTFPDRLRRPTSGAGGGSVLVVGPNQAFLHYIAQVLPSLGEGGIEQATVRALVGAEAGAPEPAEVATLKGDARLAEVLRRAVLSHVGKPVEDVVAIVATKRYRIGAHHLRRYVDAARRALGDGLRWNTARERLRMQVAEDVRRQREDAGGAPSDAETAKLARSAAVREFTDAVWPALSAPALLSRLYAEPELLARAAANTLSDDERKLLYRAPARSVRSTEWTEADAVLLDELTGLLEGTATYVHAVIDEAQDLSAMQCRAIARRCPLGSITVLGDLAQATTTWAPGDWTVTLHHLGHPVEGGAVIRQLTAGYRVPAEVLDVANRLLPHVAAGVPPATSIRRGADSLTYARTTALSAEVARCAALEGSVGVIVADADVPDVLARLGQDGIGAREFDADAGTRVSVVPASEAKGLEFDSVVLLEPAHIVAAEPSRTAGLRRLYVVLTRAVSRLVIVHDAPLPSELAGDGRAAGG